MWRPLLGAVLGLLIGVGLTAILLRGTYLAVARMTQPQLYEIDKWVYYVTMVVGAGFGSLCGTLIGLTGAILREWRRANSPGSAQP